ncbi:differentially expressed in FDCP 8 homolog [Parasteatoda tepidariorum]|uniref:differentially expressed in FDCP 8 homolog n=1 Tax=Parasteatoda tepidariorum TaxID=114398 RepID=UPI00077FD6BE|nr:differentially expressed in FDCP 8 homolog [Parasteatoda tepidariorum]
MSTVMTTWYDKETEGKNPVCSDINIITKSCCLSVENEDDKYYKHADEISQEIDTELGLSENHFSRPEGYFCFTTTEELEMAIERCKDMIRVIAVDNGEKSKDRKKYLVAKLVQLKLKLQKINEAPANLQDLTVVMGHNFELRSLERPQQYCEKCCGIIWGVMKNWYRCVDCGFKCHSKCLNLITRICANTKVLENGIYELCPCPESGLSQQKFRCAECKKKFIFKNDACLPRQCDYNGLYYCSRCHWNSISVIPARVIHNWDFTPKKVCRASLQFLRLMIKKPILNIESLNPTLFAFITELGNIKKLRQDILVMKKYFLTCHAALEEKLLLQLKDRQHFVESSDIYSLQDLIDASSGHLFTYLEKVHSTFIAHITLRCQGCRGKGFICELCKSEDVIFPFDPRTDICCSCSSVFHQDCYLRWEGPCPKCARRGKLPVAASN